MTNLIMEDGSCEARESLEKTVWVNQRRLQGRKECSGIKILSGDGGTKMKPLVSKRG